MDHEQDIAALAAAAERSGHDATVAATRALAGIEGIGTVLAGALRLYTQAGASAVAGTLTAADRRQALSVAADASSAILLVHAEFVCAVQALDQAVERAGELATIIKLARDTRNPPTLH
jgi:hypothetical protein